jgi:hypothetical protein
MNGAGAKRNPYTWAAYWDEYDFPVNVAEEWIKVGWFRPAGQRWWLQDNAWTEKLSLWNLSLDVVTPCAFRFVFSHSRMLGVDCRGSRPGAFL